MIGNDSPFCELLVAGSLHMFWAMRNPRSPGRVRILGRLGARLPGILLGLLIDKS